MPLGTMTTIQLLGNDAQYTFRANGQAAATDAQLSFVGGPSNPFPFLFHDDITCRGSLTVGIDNTALIESTGDIVAFTTSDSSLKENKRLLQSPLDIVRSIGGYRFNWKKDSSHRNAGQQDVGVIAQEIKQVLPEAVREVNGVLSVEYTKIIPVLIECIKELDSKIQELQNG